MKYKVLTLSSLAFLMWAPQVYSQEGFAYGHLFESEFPSFVASATIEKLNYQLSDVELWELLSELDQAQVNFTNIAQGAMVDSDYCLNQKKRINEMLGQVQELRVFLIKSCVSEAAPSSCASYHEQWGRLSLLSQSIAQRFGQNCLASDTVSTASLSKRLRRLGGIFNLERSAENGSVYSAAQSSTKSAVGLALELNTELGPVVSEVLARTLLEQGSLVHRVIGDFSFRESDGDFGLGIDHTIASSSGHWVSGSGDKQSVHSLSGRYSVGSFQKTSTFFWDLIYHPQLQISSSSTYSKYSHGLTLEFGEQRFSQQVKSGHRLTIVKEFGLSESIVPSNQTVSYERTFKGLAMGSSHYAIDWGLKEVRDSSFAVRLLPVFHFEIFNQRSSGLFYKQKSSTLNEQQFHDSSIKFIWDVESSFYSPLSQVLSLNAHHTFHFSDLLSVSLLAGMSHSENISKVISGDLQITKYWQTVRYLNVVRKSLELSLGLGVVQELMNVPAQAPLARAWLKPASSVRSFWTEVGLMYEF